MRQVNEAECYMLIEKIAGVYYWYSLEYSESGQRRG